MSVIKVTNENFNSVKNSDKPVLIDFYADWCGPCRMVSPIIDEIASERDDVVVCKVNVDSEAALAREFGIFSIPTIVVLEKGEIKHRSVGAKSKAGLLAMLA